MPTRWILSTMDRQHNDVVGHHAEIQCVGKSVEDRSPDLTTRPLKRKRIFDDTGNRGIDFGTKLLTEPGASCFVPASGFECFRLGFGSEAGARVTRFSTACAEPQTKEPPNPDWPDDPPIDDRVRPPARL